MRLFFKIKINKQTNKQTGAQAGLIHELQFVHPGLDDL